MLQITNVETPSKDLEQYVGFYRFKGQRKWQTSGCFDNQRECMEVLDDIWSEDIEVKMAKVNLRYDKSYG